MGAAADDALRLKAAIEFGSDYTYTVKNGGLGLTLVVDAETKEKASVARKKIPGTFEGAYVLVIYCTEDSIEDLDDLYDPN